MRHELLGSSEPGYHPHRKLSTLYTGLRYAVIHDFSVAWKLVFSLLILAAALDARDWIDSVLIIVVTALVLFAEIMNSAIEALCDFVETRHNERVGIIKDIAVAGFEVEAMLRALFQSRNRGYRDDSTFEEI